VWIKNERVSVEREEEKRREKPRRTSAIVRGETVEKVKCQSNETSGSWSETIEVEGKKEAQ